MSKDLIYKIPGKQYTAIMHMIREKYMIEAESSDDRRYTLWDTFDWKIARKGYLLFQDKDKFMLSRNKEPLFLERLDPVPETICPETFKGSGLSQQIALCVSNRALLPLRSVEEKNHYYKVLNEDSKIILHLDVEEYHTKGSPAVRYFRLRALRGYNDETREFGRYLNSIGCSEDEGTYQEKVVGEPLDQLYSSKMNLKLDVTDESQTAARKALRYKLSMAAINVDGCIQDIDIEFLHDFRVYIRRLRSFVSQVRGIFPEETVVEMKQDFSAVSGKTGQTRDLDVYLGDREAFLDMVPDELKQGLVSFFQLLAVSRDSEFVKLKTYLEGDEFNGIMSKWMKFLESAETFKEENSTRPIRETANIFIMKKLKKISKRIQALHTHTDDILMHELRIECKKLRYLLEAFISLYRDKRVNGLIKKLKKFQDYLGLLNDLTVQKETLLSCLNKLGNVDDAIMIASSVGALIVKLDERHHELKEHFVKALKDFEKSESQKTYRELFGG